VELASPNLLSVQTAALGNSGWNQYAGVSDMLADARADSSYNQGSVTARQFKFATLAARVLGDAEEHAANRAYAGYSNSHASPYQYVRRLQFQDPPAPRADAPEPSTMALLGLGVGALLLRARKRANSPR
jgi:hypothetical protein